MRWNIESTTEPGDTILDPYMGSGSTGVAALQFGRKFIGVEVELRFFEASEIRIRRDVDQGRLF